MRPDFTQYCSFHFIDVYSLKIGLRIARGLNTSIELVNLINPKRYKYYWFLTNDVVLLDEADYIETAIRIFMNYPIIGIIESCYQPEKNYTLNYVANKRRPCKVTLSEKDNYTSSIKDKKFSIIPFPIIRSLFLSKEFINDIEYVVDETNWRNWGNDEDLGYRAWKKRWWIATTPFCSISEEMFLTTKLHSETKTEAVETFKKNAELDMHRFLKNKYNSNIINIRIMIYREMLKYLDEFDKHNIDIAHCIYSGSKSIYNLIKDIRK